MSVIALDSLRRCAPQLSPVPAGLLEGTKRWQIWPTPQVRRPGDDKDSFDSLPDPVLDLSLQPGDVLYIPHNTPHRASAEGDVSLHLTVVAGPRTWAHHLLSVVQDILHNDPEFWDTPYLEDTSPEEMVSKIEQLIGRLRTVDTAAALERAQRDGRAFRGVRQSAIFQEIAAADGIDADTKLLAVDSAATFHEVTDGAARGRQDRLVARRSPGDQLALLLSEHAPRTVRQKSFEGSMRPSCGSGGSWAHDSGRPT